MEIFRRGLVGVSFFFSIIPWLSCKRSKQTELKIHSEGCERVSLLFHQRNDWREKTNTREFLFPGLLYL